MEPCVPRRRYITSSGKCHRSPGGKRFERMRHEYTIDSDRRLVIQRYHGKTGIKDIFSMSEKNYGDPDYDPSFNGMVDMTDATLDISFREMLSFVSYIRRQPSRSTGKWALLMNSSPANFGIARMFQTLAEGLQREIRFFEDEADALHWLLEQ